MPRITKNLSLDANAVKRAERYSKLHRTSLSQLVSDFLSRLRADDGEAELSPAVRRLFGVGSGRTDRESYHRHLRAKYGKRRLRG